MSIASEIKFLWTDVIAAKARLKAILEEEETLVLSTENEAAYERAE